MPFHIFIFSYCEDYEVFGFLTSSMRHPNILRNSMIFILRYMMAQKSDEVKS